MKPLRVLAAGSLRHVWPAIENRCKARYPAGIETQFGPAGLLRRRIEQGERCDLFASANLAHPLALQRAGLALRVDPFCHNTLCLSVHRRHAALPWLQLLTDPTLRVATSTPGSDPCGDYAWQLFDRLEQWDSALGNALKQRALILVGGEHSAPVPPGRQASSWIIQSAQAEVFIGYSSYAHLLKADSDIGTVSIPTEWQPDASYGLAVCHPAALPLADELLSPAGQAILLQHGFQVRGKTAAEEKKGQP